MPEVRDIPLMNLLIDTGNPRLPEQTHYQRDALRAIASDQGQKLIRLAEDIVEHGLNPADLPVVMPDASDPNLFVVLEGNRRLTALRLLENPALAKGSVSSRQFEQLRKLSTKYHRAPVRLVRCAVVSDRAEAHHWLQLRHTGENRGAGIVRWRGAEAARFRQRTGDPQPHLQVLDLLEQKALVDPNTLKRVPVSNLKRLLSSPYVREKLGITMDRDSVELPTEEKYIKRIQRVVNDLATHIKVSRIYHEDDRQTYIEEVAAATTDAASADASQSGPKPATEVGDPSPSGARTISTSQRRSTLIPSKHRLRIDDSRVNKIYHELRKLKLEDFPNAASVLFRVFLELSLDVYLERHSTPADRDSRLSYKLNAVAGDIRHRQLMADHELAPVRRAAQADSLLAPSVRTLHEYVHNERVHPIPGDLLAAWDSLQKFVETVWQANVQASDNSKTL